MGSKLVRGAGRSRWLVGLWRGGSWQKKSKLGGEK